MCSAIIRRSAHQLAVISGNVRRGSTGHQTYRMMLARQGEGGAWDLGSKNVDWRRSRSTAVTTNGTWRRRRSASYATQSLNTTTPEMPGTNAHARTHKSDYSYSLWFMSTTSSLLLLFYYGLGRLVIDGHREPGDIERCCFC